MPVRTVRIELEDPYAEFSIVMRANPPLRVFTDMQDNTDFTTLRERMRELVVDWDFGDDDGQPIPVGDFEAIPIDLFGMIVTCYLKVIAEAANVPKA